MDWKQKAARAWSWASKNNIAGLLLTGLVYVMAPQWVGMAPLIGKAANHAVADKAAQECVEHGGCE